MALTPKYANFDLTTGANDGTSEADAWQSHTDVTLTAGDHLFVKKTASRYSGGAVWNMSGSPTTEAPIIVEGYGVTPGDGIHFQMDTGVNTAYFGPLLNFDISVTSAQDTFDSTSNGNFINCIFESDVSRLSSSSESRTRFSGCVFRFNANVGVAITASTSCQFHGCLFVGTGFVSTGFVSVGGGSVFTDCAFLCTGTGNRVAVLSNSGYSDIILSNCSFKGWSQCAALSGTGGSAGSAGGFFIHNAAVEDCDYVYRVVLAANNTNIHITNVLHDGNVTAVAADDTATRDFIITGEIDAGGPVFVDAANGDFTLADPESHGEVIGGGFVMPYGVSSLGVASSGGGGSGLAGGNFGLPPISRISEVT